VAYRLRPSLLLSLPRLRTHYPNRPLHSSVPWPRPISSSFACSHSPCTEMSHYLASSRWFQTRVSHAVSKSPNEELHIHGRELALEGIPIGPFHGSDSITAAWCLHLTRGHRSADLPAGTVQLHARGRGGRRALLLCRRGSSISTRRSQRDSRQFCDRRPLAARLGKMTTGLCL
jgi:hypothetical protein